MTTGGSRILFRTMVERIDAHHHLWRYDPVRYGWIDDRMAVLCRDYLIADFEQELKSAGIVGDETE
jgi:L-fuconolactonase